MEYFKLNFNSLNIKETGTQFQSIDGIAGDVQQDFIPSEGKINFPFKIPEPFLQKKAIPTTFLNVNIIPEPFLVFEKKFLKFLGTFEIVEFQSWDLKVHHNQMIINDYSMFYLPVSSESKIINFKKSKFEINENWILRETKGEIITFNNYTEYLSTLEKHSIPPYLIADELVLDFSKQKNDILRLSNMPLTGNGYYVSIKLKNAIENERFTGFAFQEIKDMDSRIKVIY